LFAPEATADEVADVVESYVHDPDRYAALRTHILERSSTFTWTATVEKLIAIWSGSPAYSYARLHAANA
jgi:hypothetical protein